MMESNSLGNLKLSFGDIIELVLNEEVKRKASEETSNVALNVEGRRSSDRNSSKSRSKSRRGKIQDSNARREKDKVEC